MKIEWTPEAIDAALEEFQNHGGSFGEWMRAALDAAIAVQRFDRATVIALGKIYGYDAGRAAALEEAAKACEAIAAPMYDHAKGPYEDSAAAIRRLKETQG